MNGKIRKYQIVECMPNINNAGSKAPADVSDFAEQEGYKKIFIRSFCDITSKLKKIKRIIIILSDLVKAFLTIRFNSIVLIQYPIAIEKVSNIFLRILSLKKIKIITLVHDINELRYQKDSVLSEKFSFICNLSSYLIVHNEKMISYLVENGVDSKKLVNLNIFDYKVSEVNTNKEIIFDKTVVIAGNLSPKKAAYLEKLSLINNIRFDLYGVNFPKETFTNDNFVYKGVFPPEELPLYLNKGFGLIWDGDSIDTCSGPIGNYLRYNNPHKLSLYIAAGIPVFIWKEAAEAEFVRINNLGFCIEKIADIYDILNQVSENQYKTMCDSVSKISNNIRGGFYIKRALNTIEGNISL